jgi:ferric-dicitrate binding protein FerR (iron transport regulator)
MGSAKDIEAQAARWLVKLDADPTPQRRAKFDAWCNKNPRHQAAFMRLAAAWKRTDALRNVRMPDTPVDADLLAPRERFPDDSPHTRRIHFAPEMRPTALHRRHRLSKNAVAENSHAAQDRHSRLWLIALRFWRSWGFHRS